MTHEYIKDPIYPFGYKSDIGSLDIVYTLIRDGILYSRYYKKEMEVKNNEK